MPPAPATRFTESEPPSSASTASPTLAPVPREMPAVLRERPRLAISLTALAAAIPDFALGVLFLVTWISPRAVNSGMVTYLMLLMVLEFINLHSSAFMGTVLFSSVERGKKARAIAGLGAFYTLFVGGFSLAFHQAWPLVSFWGLTLNRLLGVMIGQAPSGEEQLFVRRTWAVTGISYLLFTGLTIALPLPRLGLTRDVVSSLALPGRGLWVEQPHRVLAFGFLYFVTVGISELFGHGWMPASSIPRGR